MNDDIIKTFEFEVHDTPMEKMLKSKPSKLRLYDDFFTWVIEFTFEAVEDTPEEGLLKGQEAYRFNNAFVLKNKISGTCIVATKSKNWVLNIYHSTDFVSIWFHSSDYATAKDVKLKVDNWLLGRYDEVRDLKTA